MLPLLLAGAVSCGGGEDDGAAVDVVAPGERIAWTGSAGEVDLVVERLARPHDADNTRLTEEQMLRDRLPLEGDEALLRLHLLGPAAELEQAGSLEVAGAGFLPYGAAPAALDARQRLLWNGVLRGLPVARVGEDGRARRTLLLHGPDGRLDPLPSTLRWKSATRAAELELRTWSEVARRAHLDEALGVEAEAVHVEAPPADPSVPPDSVDE